MRDRSNRLRRIVRWLACGVCLACTVPVASAGYRSVLTGWSNGRVVLIEDGDVVAEFDIPGQVSPFGVALTSDGSILYATDSDGTLLKLGLAAGLSVETVDLGERAGRLAIRRDETRLYVVDSLSETVLFVDAESLSAFLEIPAAPGPRTILLGPDDQALYVGQNGVNEPDRLTKFDAMNGAVIDSIAFDQGWPSGMALSSDGSLLYLALESEPAIATIDLATFTVTQTVPFSHRPAEIVMDPSGWPMYVTSWFDRAVLRVDPQTLQVLDTIENLPTPAGADVTPDGSELYVHMGGNFEAFVIDTASFTVKRTVQIGGNSRGFGRFIAEIEPPTQVPATSARGVAILLAAFLALSLWTLQRRA